MMHESASSLSSLSSSLSNHASSDRLPLYSCAYFFEIKKDWLGIDWSCSPDDNGNFIISGMIASCVFWYITIKAVLYILCAVMNWHMNRVNGVEVSKPNMNDFVH